MESGGRSRTPKAGAFIQEDGSIDLQESFKRSADEYMPMAHVTRIMRRGLPPHAKIAEVVKENIHECVSEFINVVTSEANEKCHREYRNTVSTEDVIATMGSLGFDSYVELLTAYMGMHRARDPENDHNVPYARRRRPPAMLRSQMGGYPRSNRGGGEGSSGGAGI